MRAGCFYDNPAVCKLRFAIAADICSDWAEFGGIDAQINLIGVLSNISIVGNPFIAMKYDEAINKRLATFPRERARGVIIHRLLTMGILS